LHRDAAQGGDAIHQEEGAGGVDRAADLGQGL
jgi:hypothetical protein